MSKDNKTLLFSRDSVTPYSRVFMVRKQVTVVALGLAEGQAIQFRMVQLKSGPPVCPCPPLNVQLPDVQFSAPLTCCGDPIELTDVNPYVIIDAPQGVNIQAQYLTTTEQPNFVAEVWYTESNTQDVNDRQRGCPCQTQ